MFFFKSYPNSGFATFLSILGALSLIFGAFGVISFFTAGMKDSGNIVMGLVFAAVWFILNKLARKFADKKGI